MKKSTKRLLLSSETLRTLSTARLDEVAGGLPRESKGTCGVGDCETYWCLTMRSCA